MRGMILKEGGIERGTDRDPVSPVKMPIATPNSSA